jgi:anti-sigma factor ChrR (cupin superfamily)
MLKCRDIVHKADDYLEGKLSTKQKLGFRMHLFMCKYCNQYIKKLTFTIAGLKNTQKTPSVDDQELDHIYDLVKKQQKSANKNAQDETPITQAKNQHK